MNERPEPPHPPYDDLRAALGDRAEGHTALNDLHSALSEDAPSAADVHASVERLRNVPGLEARIVSWFEAPRTQNWLKILSDAGL